jgi:hypothetical protein
MKKKYFLFIYILLLLSIVTSPYWLWQLKPQHKLTVLIMDKTVPNNSYREHKGLMWVLDNAKYVKSNLRPYAINSDYKGFKPESENKYKMMELPKNLNTYDVIYLTDQYGVYKNDYFRKGNLGTRSQKIEGGLTTSDIDHIEKALVTTKGKTLIAEFNTFGSPTTATARDKISNLLNLDWSGWIGRYFPDLNSSEVPDWVKKNYQKENHKWNFSGEGFVFVNKNDYTIVIDKNEITDQGALFQLTSKGKKQFHSNFKSLYQYWFDINVARDKDEVLASYHLPLSNTAKKTLNEYGIPASFPAVIYHQTAKYSTYYFSGDFADQSEVPKIYQTVGFDRWKEYFSTKVNFYWKVYIPMLKEIFKNGLHHEMEQEKVEITSVDGLQMNSQTNGDFIQVQKNGKWQDLLIKGVNMGIGKPGYFPGQTSITKEEYLRWFKEIGDMNANAIRIYTLHPPAFYEAFYEYNQTAKKPLYLFHGTWINEQGLINTQDAFAQQNIDDAKTEIKNMIDIIHGHANLPIRPGHAFGKYKYDISKYVIGFIIGIEWDPEMVENTNINHKGMNQFKGDYFKTENGSPFEVWLAQLMNYATDYESKQYKWQHSLSFTNWVTTDLLNHPTEPLKDEDLVSVDPNHIKKSSQFHAGLFASYHIYPYYPDFLNYDSKYLNYTDFSGKKNNYAGYLNDLRKSHNMPVLVAEYGVPASRGMTHLNPFGMNQGFLSEEQQGQIDNKLYSSIVSEGYAGGLLFSWQDEWFKRTWNTMDLDNPDRRPYWSNVQTNEQHFGLLGFDPGEKDLSIIVDGNVKDWKMAVPKVIYQSKTKNTPINQVRISSDNGYLYYLLTYNQPVDFKKQGTYLLLDTIPNQGQTKIPLTDHTSIRTNYGIDFLVKLNSVKDSRITVDSYYDSFYYEYAKTLHMLREKPYANKKDNGVFNPIRLALNKDIKNPETKTQIPFQSYETGKLMFGDANPEHKGFNSLTDVSISKDKKVIEGRIPWQLLNVKDPSLREIMSDIWKDGLTGSQKIEGIRVSLAVTNQQKIIETFPMEENAEISQTDSVLYKWKEWEEPSFHERLKKSYYIMQETYRSTKINKDLKTK